MVPPSDNVQTLSKLNHTQGAFTRIRILQPPKKKENQSLIKVKQSGDAVSLAAPCYHGSERASQDRQGGCWWLRGGLMGVKVSVDVTHVYVHACMYIYIYTYCSFFDLSEIVYAL